VVKATAGWTEQINESSTEVSIKSESGGSTSDASGNGGAKDRIQGIWVKTEGIFLELKPVGGLSYRLRLKPFREDQGPNQRRFKRVEKEGRVLVGEDRGLGVSGQFYATGKQATGGGHL